MAYKVRVTEFARQDMQSARDFIFDKSQSRAIYQRWYSAVKQALRELRDFPSSHPTIPESESIGRTVRESFIHSHRIIFTVDEATKTVIVHRLYHSSRKPLTRQQIKDE